MPDQSSVDADKNPKAEMTACAKCGRQTPVNRLSCLYCGTLIEIASDAGSDLKIKVPEAWQYGFNIVIRAGSEIGNLLETSSNLSGEALQSLIESKAAVPIYRVGSQPEAENLSNRLKNKGIAAEIIPDLELISDKNPVRLRRIEYSDTDNCFYLTAFDSNKTQGKISLPAYEISVIVLGGWLNRVTEQKYKKRSDKDDKARDESVFEGLNLALDIYPKGFRRGYRVPETGFDFSVLGEKMSRLASENLKALAGLLLSKSEGAALVRFEKELQRYLENLWQPEVSNITRDVPKVGLGRRSSKSTLVSNEMQFLKFSRLQAVVLP